MMLDNLNQELKKLIAEGKTAEEAADILKDTIADLADEIKESTIEEQERLRRKQETERAFIKAKAARADLGKEFESFRSLSKNVPASFRPVHEAYLALVKKSYPNPQNLSPHDLAVFIEAALKAAMNASNSEMKLYSDKFTPEVIHALETSISGVMLGVLIHDMDSII